MSQAQPEETNRPGRSVQRIPVVLIVIFAVAAIAVGIGAYIFVKNVVSGWTMTPIENISLSNNPNSGQSGNSASPAGTQSPNASDNTQAEIGPTLQPWDGTSRVNILVMGLDYEDTVERRNPRTDSMWLFTIDPLSKTAGMLSIPRDLWVNIPGAGYGKINTAFAIGSASKLPGGGPGLAVQTVEELLGVPIQYYAQIDFDAFVKFIDDIDGINLDIKEEIKVDPLGKYNTVILKPGVHHVYGAVALAYARQRYTKNDDFDRSQRQYEVIMEVRRRLTKPEAYPRLFAKAPQIYKHVSSGIHTNLSFDQIIRLGLLIKDIDPANIKHAIISPKEVTFAKSPDGLDILKPITDKIRILRDEIFTTGGPLSPGSVASADDPAGLMKAEGAKVAIQNGSGVSGLAGRTHDYLEGMGVNVLSPADSGEQTSATKIYDYTGKPYTVKFLVDTLKINKNQIVNKYDPNAPSDIVVVLGGDWANSNSMP
ncbi:MAG TPA: LCP family protein [Anaerolineaceae bacterium]|nr:LCP family protein [Anaerolineaceae bacterium]